MSEFYNMMRPKLQKSIWLVCQLYRDNLITEAYIIGSVAKGTARKESDIDILIINPKFEASMEYMSPDEESENLKKVVDKLKNIGAKFKLIEKEKDFIYRFWYQLYKEEIFHIMPQKYFINSLPHVQITRDICND
jgi:predicted nucleotidyltransferase